MTKSEKLGFKKILDDKVKNYFEWANRKDYPDKPCVRKAVNIAQNTVFTLAEILWHQGIITWEECCEYWSKVGFLDECNENCKFTDCGANVDGVCKYTIEEG